MIMITLSVKFTSINGNLYGILVRGIDTKRSLHISTATSSLTS